MPLSEDEKRTLRVLLDEIIPPSSDGRMPGAGQIGVAERLAGEMEQRPDGLAGLQAGLATLDRAARGECGSAFAELAREDRKRILAGVPEAAPALVPGLLFPTWVAYYEHPRVLAALGREPRPPHPGGYELEAFDDRLLDGVRRRARLYREC